MGTVSTTLPSDGQTIDSSDVNTPINAILSEFNGNIDDNNIKTGANINGAKLLAGSLPGTSFDTTLASGWLDLADTPDTVTNNGNRSYDLVFNSTDLTDTVSTGMRLRTTRTVTAPTQCADLEASSSQYFSATSASLAGMTFADDFTTMAWVKLESYALGGIISRFNGTNGWCMRVTASGTVELFAGATTFDTVGSYQSLPLNKWVHVSASLNMSAGTGEVYIDGVLVPSVYTNSGGTSLTQGTNFHIGTQDGSTNFFDGKIAQVAVFSSVLSASTIRSYMSQGLSGSESTLVSAFSCSNSLLDLNTTNNNDLTANGGALMTNVDSPFGNYLGGTLDYAIITKTAFSTNTTLTVQVPEGCTIPTSGGVSAVAYSTQKAPYGMPVDVGRWAITSLHKTTDPTTSNATYGSYMSGGWKLTVPIGAWTVGWQGDAYNVTTTVVYFGLSSTALTGLTSTQGTNITPLTLRIVSPSAAAWATKVYSELPQSLTSSADYLMYTLGAVTSAGIDGTGTGSEIFAKFNLL